MQDEIALAQHNDVWPGVASCCTWPLNHQRNHGSLEKCEAMSNTELNGDGASLMPIGQEYTLAQPGLTVAQLAKRYRVSPDKIRSWIKSGELAAINTANRRCARPRYVVTIDALAAFERGRRVAVPDTPERKPRRRRRLASQIDFFPN